MRSIKPLPEAVHSSVRSSLILFNLTRIVEELVFNSLDAGAIKVSVSLGVGTCYVKVVDDGTGITRDGLVLLGERYATSKLHHLADMDVATGSFGFRGEALGSISDVSLLEIVTKAHGRPNGYRKVMKGCKCLYLGIDDDRQVIGTTVIVRDLFYNQPVRRKHMLSRPKKVLHSVKKCVLRIALVHSKVSFRVIDIESEDELLCTHPSSSPLSLLMSGFGIDVSSSLHELNFSDDILKISGYVSGPCDTFPMKAFQYVYINSRFVCKGPIHRLLNQLATRFKCLAPWKADTGSQNGKRSRFQACPTYILNLSCPRSRYDLTFEPSKTSVEFKDWVPVLNFIEKAITHFWSENIAPGESFSHAADILGKDEMWKEGDNTVAAEDFFDADLLAHSEIAKKRCRIHNHQASRDLPPSSLEILTEESDHISHWKDNRIPFQELHRNTVEFEEQQTEMEFLHQTNSSFQSWDGSLAKCISIVNQESNNHLWASDNGFFSGEDNLLESKFTAAERSTGHVEDCVLGSAWGDESLKVDSILRNGSTGSALSCDCFEFSSDVEGVTNDLKKPFLQSCSSRGCQPPDGPFFVSDERFEFQIDGFRTKRKRLDPDGGVDVVEVDGQSFDFFPRTLLQDKAAEAWPSPRLIKPDTSTDLEFLSRDSVKSFPLDEQYFAEENDLPDSVAQIGNFGSAQKSLNSEWCSVSLDPLLGSSPWDVEHFSHEKPLEGSFRSGNSASYGHFADKERKDCYFSYDIMPNRSGQENSSSSCTNMGLDFKGYASPKREICKFLQGYSLDDIFSPRRSGTLADETDWLFLDSYGKDHTVSSAISAHHITSSIYIDKDENQRDQLRYQDCEQNHVHKERSRRSHSAPPFYRGKMKFFALNNRLTVKAGKPNVQTVCDAPTLPETSELKHPQQSCVCDLYIKSSFVEDSLFNTRPDTKKMPVITGDMNEIQKSEKFEQSRCLHINDTDSVKGHIPKEIHDSINSGVKWRHSCSETANKSRNLDDHCNILDISSGILHLAGDSLVPESIDRNCLEDAKVLQQVDKKFIPVVAGRTLAIIDQHAADERIRLEELRQKVLSGEVRTVTYLDAEQELALPEIGYQLLHNYAEQIRNWGWICNIHAQDSRSFTKNLNLLHRRPTVVTLLAVPCILGVNLSDADLLEFLQQLSDTDGSSTLPPAVLRVLNFKACRGAIMFGDTLLPSECSLIVEELKRTSLCFQCAHGRPTTVPLVNLEALHKQIDKLGLWNYGSNEKWHGLHRHELSLERTAQRLNSARGQCS